MPINKLNHIDLDDIYHNENIMPSQDKHAVKSYIISNLEQSDYMSTLDGTTNAKGVPFRKMSPKGMVRHLEDLVANQEITPADKTAITEQIRAGQRQGISDLMDENPQLRERLFGRQGMFAHKVRPTPMEPTSATISQQMNSGQMNSGQMSSPQNPMQQTPMDKGINTMNDDRFGKYGFNRGGFGPQAQSGGGNFGGGGGGGGTPPPGGPFHGVPGEEDFFKRSGMAGAMGEDSKLARLLKSIGPGLKYGALAIPAAAGVGALSVGAYNSLADQADHVKQRSHERKVASLERQRKLKRLLLEEA